MMVLALMASACVPLAACRDPSIPPRICVENIKAIRLGMTQAEVDGVLGAPSYGCMREDALPTWRTCAYLNPEGRARLWVHFDNDKVGEVYAKRSFLGDDEGVYLLSPDLEWEPADFRSTFPPCSADH